MNNSIISQFIVDDEQVKQNTESLVKKALKYGKVTKNGDILVEDSTISQDLKLKLCLVLRFLANSLEETISEVIRPAELVKVMGERGESVGSRLSILVKEGFAKKAGYGKYVVQPHRIEKFLNEIDEYNKTFAESNNTIKKTTHVSKGKKRGPSTYSGIGSDIQNLIDEGFFEKPKFISEVAKKLEEQRGFEYHDIRVIDKTVRGTFKNILKPISNKEGGRAKWKYVVKR